MKLKKQSFGFALSLLAMQSVSAQNTYSFIGANGASWIRQSNWSGGAASKSPGVDANPNTTVDGATNDIAAFSTSSTIVGIGINMNTSTGSGVTANGAANQSLTLGAITFATGGTSGNFLIGNNSTTLAGTLTLTGTTVGGNSNVILQNSSANTMTLANTQGSGNKTMDVGLGNAGNNIVRITGAGGITISSIVKNANNLTLEGGGTGPLTLSGANTYSGTTTVNAGTLLINGNQTAANGAVSVAAGATLGGNGTVGGSTTISGTHAPGSAAGVVGTQTFSSTVNYASGSIFSWDLNANSITTDFDKVVAAGTINADNAVFNVVLGTGVDQTATFWSTPNSTKTWAMTNIFGSTFTGSFTSVTLTNATPAFTALGGFTVDGSSLTWTAVPEPTSALAGLLIAAGLLRRRRVG